MRRPSGHFGLPDGLATYHTPVSTDEEVTVVGIRSDEDIKRDVIESLYWDTRVDAADIGVFVQDGQVRLVGTVPTYRSWRAAREDALVIRGVRRVDNRVEVEISPELTAPADDDLRDALVEVVTTDPDLAAGHIDVVVKQGRVTLRGTVADFCERELARTVVSAAPGVRGVHNELVVVPHGDHTATSIAKAIIDALRRNRHVDLSAIDVAVDGGQVTLAGEVADTSVSDHILDAARYTPGVTEIVDKIHVIGPH